MVAGSRERVFSSAVWKVGGRFLQGMEKNGRFFTQYGKIFSAFYRVWKGCFFRCRGRAPKRARTRFEGSEGTQGRPMIRARPAEGARDREGSFWARARVTRGCLVGRYRAASGGPVTGALLRAPQIPHRTGEAPRQRRGAAPVAVGASPTATRRARCGACGCCRARVRAPGTPELARPRPWEAPCGERCVPKGKHSVRYAIIRPP